MRKARQDPIFDPADASTELPRAKAAEFILGMVEGSILALGGIDGEGLRVILDAVEPDRCGRRALFAWIAPAPTAEAIVEQALNLLAETARRLWPLWFTDVSFAGCRDDRLGRLAVDAIARSAAKEIAGLSATWAAAAALSTSWALAMPWRPSSLMRWAVRWRFS